METHMENKTFDQTYILLVTYYEKIFKVYKYYTYYIYTHSHAKILIDHLYIYI